MVARTHKRPPRPLSFKRSEALPVNMPEILVLDTGDIETKPILLTVELAQFFLDTQGMNRKPSRAHTASLAEGVDDGDWMLTHQGIAIDTNGRMIDGQQRCLSVIRTGKPIQVFLTTGLDPDVFKVLDSGKRRSPSDVLGMKGETYTAQTSATIRLLHAYELALHSDTLTLSSTFKTTVSSSRVLRILERFPEIRDSVPLGWDIAKWTHLTPSMASALHFVMAYENKEMADRMAADVKSGADLSYGDIALALRNYNPFKKIRSPQTLVHSIFRAGRRALDGEEVRYIKYTKELAKFKVFELGEDNSGLT